jgi:cytochrome c oxidase cbb3-type subunit 3
MADLPNDFWSGWIIVVTGISFVALVWLVLSIYFFSDGKSPILEESEEPVWDEDLREGSNAPPLWWFWFILAAMVFSVVYLILYPGLGSFKGVLNWSQDSRLESSYETYTERFSEVRQSIAESSLTKLQGDAALMETAEHIYARHCAACHAADGRGQASLFPNLMDASWQWGGTQEQIEQTIRRGRKASMISWQAILGEDDITQLADYALTLGDNQSEQHPAHDQYVQYCSACHGVDGTGNVMLGAPSLADDVWLYGDTPTDVQTSISQGRNGIMPAFEGRLDDAQIRLLVAWLARSSN